jgi:hypothetical protein
MAFRGSSGITESRPPSAARTWMIVGTSSGDPPMSGCTTAPSRAGSAPFGTRLKTPPLAFAGSAAAVLAWTATSPTCVFAGQAAAWYCASVHFGVANGSPDRPGGRWKTTRRGCSGTGESTLGYGVKPATIVTSAFAPALAVDGVSENAVTSNAACAGDAASIAAATTAVAPHSTLRIIDELPRSYPCAIVAQVPGATRRYA